MSDETEKTEPVVDRAETEKLARDVRMIIYFLGVLVIGGWVYSWLGYGRDATDPPEGWRSGLEVYTDAGTGCQYLSARGGSLTPRLSSGGAHVGCP